ncbi:MAG TPA: nucleotidyltransferase domain-containing protein [Elusimicrobia bacterium]|nr:nucleotidyltransferase domain-containing protein [Elusimicrobiota bacterium]
MITAINRPLKEFKENIKMLYGDKLKNIILYGSWARGTATDDSDIDLIVTLTGNVTPGAEIDKMINVITEVNLKYGVLISVYPVSEKEYSITKSPILMNVRKEGISV